MSKKQNLKGPLVVFNGTLIGDEGEVLVVLTAHGDVVRIPSKSVLKTVQLTASDSGLMGFYVERDTTVSVDTPVASLTADGTVTKWYDDGGTISKSTDDMMATNI